MTYLPFMRLWVDGCTASWNFSALRTFGEVMEEVGRKAAASGRVVSRVSVDGREISTRLEREMAERAPGDVGDVRISTTTPADLLREALEGGLTLCAAILGDVRSVVSFLRSGDLPAATSLYATCVESLATFFQLAGAIFNGFQCGAFPLPEGTSGTGGLPAPPSSTAEILEQLLSAQKAEEWEAMAALLSDRIAPNLEEWSAFLSAIRGPEAK